ncbi:phosphate ABC transporter permease PstA [Pseudonocardia sp. K10HN5]|uniref:Phosphate transport system permease protein PstA n=2 Tax=Pseudonocardia acidicola TaxID=2724939 RepID=A0ABX1SDM2_9PSEU|nr:phosphate ABC transporter permease PstA [Pseudonocardia acidicola]NMH99669.1 phosphate ABC transporter permease PstA [Pseudonocardia acidicola]
MLRRPRLPGWALPAIAVAAVAVTALLFAVTPMQGRADFLVFAAVLYIVAQTALSAVVEGSRKAKDRFVTTMLVVCTVAAVLPLVAVLGFTIVKGLQALSPAFLTTTMRGVAEQDPDGGIYQAIVGTIQQVGLATLLAVPFGIVVAIYLVEYSSGRLGRLVSFYVDVMTGLPSIVAGLFILAFWILALGQPFSGFAGALALAILMLPTVVRATEEMLKIVPAGLREGSYALGVRKWVTVLRIVLPTALPGIVTGVMLAVARVTGETAPLLVTVFGNTALNANPFSGPQAALPLFVYQEAGLPDETAINRAWAAALVLIIIVLLLNIIARFIARFARVRG